MSRKKDRGRDGFPLRPFPRRFLCRGKREKTPDSYFHSMPEHKVRRHQRSAPLLPDFLILLVIVGVLIPVLILVLIFILVLLQTVCLQIGIAAECHIVLEIGKEEHVVIQMIRAVR